MSPTPAAALDRYEVVAPSYDALADGYAKPWIGRLDDCPFPTEERR